MTSTPKHSVSVAGVVIDDENRVLVIQRADNLHWEPPGGVLEITESPIDGVVREIEEETGYVVDVESLSGVYKNVEAGVLALVFRCTLRGGKATTSNESVCVRWMTQDEVVRLMDEAYAIRVTDAFVRGESTPVRKHDGKRILTL